MATKRTRLNLPLPLQFLAAWLGVRLGRVLQEQVDFLKAENQLLREKLGTKRVRLTTAARRRRAALGNALGRRGLAAVATIATPRDDPALVPRAGGQEVRRQPIRRVATTN